MQAIRQGFRKNFRLDRKFDPDPLDYELEDEDADGDEDGQADLYTQSSN